MDLRNHWWDYHSNIADTARELHKHPLDIQDGPLIDKIKYEIKDEK